MTRTVATLIAVAFAVAGGSAFAASPGLNDVTPKGGQRGTEVALTLSGANLADTLEVLLDTPGLLVGKPEVVNPTAVKLAVTIPVDCRLGEHGFRLRTATGLTD